MHVHILGICGTFMGGIARIAKQLGHQVTGMDEHVYPPMSTQLQQLGITLISGYQPDTLPQADIYVIGNAMKRGNPAVETILRQHLPYTSGPQWLAEHILGQRHVLAVSGTHGKTTTATMLTWILQQHQLAPGYLIGGVPLGLPHSADVGGGQYFVVEADEYDTAFFDKRSKFLHYHPDTLIINNLEYDHADIFPDLAAIQKQFAHVLRVVPDNGQVIVPANDPAVAAVLTQGCWSPQYSFGLDEGDWQAQLRAQDGSEFDVVYKGQLQGTVHWQLLGLHNVKNALAAICASSHVGVPVAAAIAALAKFAGVKRRLEIRGRAHGITIYDDFAHHPTAIATTLGGLRAHVGRERIIAIVDFASNTMHAGVHGDSVLTACQDADTIIFANAPAAMQALAPTFNNVPDIISEIQRIAQPGDHVLVMSNKGFGDIHTKLLAALEVSHA